MKYLIVKMFRDMKAMIYQFYAILLMAFVGVAIYTGLEGAWHGLEAGLDNYFAMTGVADAWAVADGFSDEEARRISRLPGVSAAEREMVGYLDIKSPGVSGDPELRLAVCAGGNAHQPFLVTEGADFDGKSDGLWLDADFAGAKSLWPGDSLTVSMNGRRTNMRIMGLVLAPEYVCYLGSQDDIIPDHDKYAFGYANEHYAAEIFGAFRPNKLNIYYSEGADEGAIREGIDQVIKGRTSFFMNHGLNASIKSTRVKISQMFKISLLFSSIFVLLALLTIVTTMKRIVSAQRIQIGTLAALGTRGSVILAHYSLYGFIVSLLGAVLGLLLGPAVLSEVLLGIQLKIYSIPFAGRRLTWLSALLVVLIVGLCTLAAALASRGGLKAMPAESLRNSSAGNVRYRRAKGEGMSSGAVVSFEWRWIFRELSKNLVRFLMGVAGVVGCVTLIMASLGLQDSANYANDFLYSQVYTYRYKLNIDRYFDTGKARGDFAQLLEEDEALFNAGARHMGGRVSVMEEDGFVSLYDAKGRRMSLADHEGVMSHMLARTLGVKAGDEVAVRCQGAEDELRVRVTGISNNPAPQGLFLHRDVWEGLGMDFLPTAVLTSDEALAGRLGADPSVSRVLSVDDQSRNVKKLLDSFTVLFNLLILAAITMGWVVLYNLGLLSYSERGLIYATLKVLGFRRLEVTSLAYRENAFITVLGLLLGVPAGLSFLRLYVGLVSADNFEWPVKLNDSSFVASLALTAVCAVFVNYVIAGKINGVRMAESLKALE
ncbi:MAG: ABC transporter permease [Clostridiales Family XIII bacterium]|jgi:putative ABC transport system permease protein|nr:ABC transporter permease [Clostridiales Family XIII bacterium]